MSGVTVSGNVPTARASTANNSTTPLDAGQTFTGAAERNNLNDVIVSCKTDQDGKLYFDFSNDATNWDTFPSNGFVLTAGVHEFHTAVKGLRYFRVRVTNTSSSNQTYLRLYTYYGSSRQSNLPLNQAMGNDTDAIATRPSHYNYEVALSLRSNATTWNKWGYNADIDIGTETVWNVGGLFARMTSADTLNLVSTSANDTSAGTGARSVIVYGVDENFAAITEVVTLNGTTPVTTTNQWMGVNRIAIYLSGSGGENAGDITASVTTGGSIQGRILAGEGATQQAFFFVQAGYTALMDWLYINAIQISGGGSPNITTRCWVTSLVSGSKYEVFRDYLDTSVENHNQYNPSQPFVVGEKSLVEFRSTTDTNNTGVSIRFSLIEVKNLG